MTALVKSMMERDTNPYSPSKLKVALQTFPADEWEDLKDKVAVMIPMEMLHKWMDAILGRCALRKQQKECEEAKDADQVGYCVFLIGLLN